MTPDKRLVTLFTSFTSFTNSGYLLNNSQNTQRVLIVPQFNYTTF